MPIPTVREFQKNTSPLVKKLGLIKLRTKGYGSNMAKVLAALEVYWAHIEAEASVRTQLLYRLWKECDHWLRLKAGKTSNSELLIRRRGHVENLQREALAALVDIDPYLTTAFLNYQNKKQNGTHGLLTSLKPGYSVEREYYLKHGKPSGQSVSGSHIDSHLSEDQPGVEPHIKNAFRRLGDRKGFGQINLKDAEQLVRSGAITFRTALGGNVIYYNKIERLKYLATIDRDGHFRTIDDQLIAMNGNKSFGKYRMGMYAMDHYGNVYVCLNMIQGKNVVMFEDRTQTFTRVRGDFFNHSSFLAGREVICAGCLHIGYNCRTGLEEPGVLSAIDNSSGHYKPDSNALRACLMVLANEGVDLERVRVSDFSNGLNNVRLYWAVDFLVGGQPWISLNETTPGVEAPPIATGTGIG